jgi:hypothetical protein
MNKRFFAAAALSGAAFAAMATPAHAAVAGLGQPGGPFGAAAFAVTDLIGGVPAESLMPNPGQVIEQAKQQQAQHGH